MKQGVIVRKYDIDSASGFIEEEELEAITTGGVNGGSTPTPVISAISTTVASATAVSALTFNATPCPTSACTKSC